MWRRADRAIRPRECRCSSLPAERLIAIMRGRGRWCQENAFKHGNQRWGINHLDGRKVDPEERMPNPARRRLDIARRAAHVREGAARCILFRYSDDHPRHQRACRDLAAALDVEQAIDALRPSVPTHARVADTELAGKLVRHDGRRKLSSSIRFESPARTPRGILLSYSLPG